MAQISFFRGDTHPVVYFLINKKTKEAIDIAGYTFKLTVSTEKNPVDETSKKFFIDGVIDDASEGRFSFTPTAEQNSTVGTFYFDIQMFYGGSYRKTIMKDKYVITQDIGK